MRTIASLTVIMFLVFFSFEANSAEFGSIRTDRARLLQKESGGVWLVDIRNPDVFEAGHIEGSINIPSELLKVKQFTKGKKIILIDDSVGQALAKKCAQALTAKGLDILVLEGGIREWQREGYPFTNKLFSIGVVTPMELRNAFEEKIQLRILDLRDEDEFRKGSLPGAGLIKGSDISERIAVLKAAIENQDINGRSIPETNIPVIVILPGGHDPQTVAQNVKGNNAEIRYLLGGFEAWAASFGEREKKVVGNCPYCTVNSRRNK